MKCDAELTLRLAEAADDELLDAVLYLQPEGPDAKAVAPDRMEAVFRGAVDRAGAVLDRVKPLPNLGLVNVRARAEALRALLQQPEIASALSSRRSK